LFQQPLQKLGWIVGSNVRFDIRWGENNPDRDRKLRATASEAATATSATCARAGARSLAQRRTILWRSKQYRMVSIWPPVVRFYGVLFQPIIIKRECPLLADCVAKVVLPP
jgi:hypothetical protein